MDSAVAVDRKSWLEEIAQKSIADKEVTKPFMLEMGGDKWSIATNRILLVAVKEDFGFGPPDKKITDNNLDMIVQYLNVRKDNSYASPGWALKDWSRHLFWINGGKGDWDYRINGEFLEFGLAGFGDEDINVFSDFKEPKDDDDFDGWGIMYFMSDDCILSLASMRGYKEKSKNFSEEELGGLLWNRKSELVKYRPREVLAKFTGRNGIQNNDEGRAMSKMLKYSMGLLKEERS